MTPDRLCRGDCLRCRCEEGRAYVSSVVLPPRAVVRVLLRSWRDADPASVSALPQQGSSFLTGLAFPSHIRQFASRSEEHTSELQSLTNLVCRLLLEKKKSTYDT